jgi:hypothetical protein
MPPDPRPTALEAARGWLAAWVHGSYWTCEEEAATNTYKTTMIAELAALITRREQGAVEVAIPKVGKSDEDLARAFHETYERLAPKFGYKTRESSAKPWVEVPETNRNLMIAVCSVIRSEIEQEAKVGALEDLRKVIASGAAGSYADYADATLETLAWVDKRIEDAIKAEGGSDAGR